MENGTTQWIEIARTGEFTDMGGRTVRVTGKELDKLAATETDAPLVFGHPATDAPAYGWVAGLKVAGDRLLARFKQVPQAVRELVAGGRYKYVSMRISPDFRLVHVGLLGATAPAIDGLKPVAFAADGNDMVLKFSQEQNQEDGVNPDELKKEIEELKALLAEKTAALIKAEEALDTEKKDFAAFRTETESKAREARVLALVEKGKVLPADRQKVLQFARALAAGGDTMDFAAPDGSTEKIPADEAFLRDLERRPDDAYGLFSEFATPERAGERAQAGGDVPLNLAAKF